jgi:hypothetical protein
MVRDILKLRFYVAFQWACSIVFQNWRKLIMPILFTGLLFGACNIAFDIIMHNSIFAYAAVRMLFLLIPVVIFLLEAGLINFLLHFFEKNKGTWRSLAEVFFWKRLRRLLGVFLWIVLTFACFMPLLVQLLKPFFNMDYALYTLIGMLILLPIQFFAILSVLENPDAPSRKAFLQGLRDTIYQRWEMWGAWFLALLFSRIFAKVAWVLVCWVPSRFLGFYPHNAWLWLLLFSLLISCIFPFGIFFLLFLRKMKAKAGVTGSGITS